MSKYLADDIGSFDAGDDLHGIAAGLAIIASLRRGGLESGWQRDCLSVLGSILEELCRTVEEPSGPVSGASGVTGKGYRA